MFFTKEDSEKVKNFIHDFYKSSDIVRTIIATACCFANVEDVEKLFNHTQSRDVTFAKQLSCYLLVENGFKRSYVAKIFGMTQPNLFVSLNKIQSLLDIDEQKAKIILNAKSIIDECRSSK